MSSATVVLPAPPTVTLPQQVTGTGARQPGRATRQAVAAAVSAANGASSVGASQPPPRAQKAGARRCISLHVRTGASRQKIEQGRGGPVRQVGVPREYLGCGPADRVAPCRVAQQAVDPQSERSGVC